VLKIIFNMKCFWAAIGYQCGLAYRVAVYLSIWNDAFRLFWFRNSYSVSDDGGLLVYTVQPGAKENKLKEEYMFAFLSNNMGTILTGLVLLGIVTRVLIGERARKTGRASVELGKRYKTWYTDCVYYRYFMRHRERIGLHFYRGNLY
jgi:hypothetical protein